MGNITDTTFFIPDLIKIEFFRKNNKPFLQENILIGIQTHASYRNDINISPFVSDKSGKIEITKNEICKRVEQFISHGIMDYSSIEYARPNIEIYFWGNKKINIIQGYDIDQKLLKVMRRYDPAFSEQIYKERRQLQRRKENDYLIFENCYNRTTGIKENITLVTDIWNTSQKEVFYKVNLSI